MINKTNVWNGFHNSKNHRTLLPVYIYTKIITIEIINSPGKNNVVTDLTIKLQY